MYILRWRNAITLIIHPPVNTRKPRGFPFLFFLFLPLFALFARPTCDLSLPARETRVSTLSQPARAKPRCIINCLSTVVVQKYAARARDLLVCAPREWIIVALYRMCRERDCLSIRDGDFRYRSWAIFLYEDSTKSFQLILILFHARYWTIQEANLKPYFC